jgi:hypothetical protein
LFILKTPINFLRERKKNKKNKINLTL